MQHERERIKAHMAQTGGTYSKHAHGGNCMVCGNANAIYTVLFHHAKSNTYVRMGQDCAHKCDCAYDDNAFRRFCDAAVAAEHAKAGKAKAQGILTNEGLGNAWTVYNSDNPDNHYEENTISDMVGKLVKYGSLSDKQYSFMRSLLDKIANRAQIAAARAAERDAALPVPEGRMTIIGKVLSIKVKETRYGYVSKMLVQSRDGWKVYGSQPKHLNNVERGDIVEFTATIEKSKDDPKFGFFSRPIA
jgi:hypothetical protein